MQHSLIHPVAIGDAVADVAEVVEVPAPMVAKIHALVHVRAAADVADPAPTVVQPHVAVDVAVEMYTNQG